MNENTPAIYVNDPPSLAALVVILNPLVVIKPEPLVNWVVLVGIELVNAYADNALVNAYADNALVVT